MDNPREIADRAWGLIRESRFSEAEKLIAGALSVHPGEPKLCAARVDVLSAAGRHAEALSTAQEALKSCPRSYAILVSAGKAALAAGEREDAASYFRGAVSAFPTPYAFGRLAASLLSLGDVAAALRAVEDGLRLQRDHRDLLRIRADIYARQGERDRALQELDEARRLQPQDGFLTRKYAAERLKGVAPEAAASELAGMLRVAPHDRNGHLWDLYGGILDKTGRHEDAEAALRKALDLMPGNAYFTRSLGFFLHRRGRFAEAKELLARAFLRRPKDLPLRSAMLKAYEEAGDLAGLLCLLDRAAAEHPDVKPLLGIRKRYEKRIKAEQVEECNAKVKNAEEGD